jgi:hypothetical protein
MKVLTVIVCSVLISCGAMIDADEPEQALVEAGYTKPNCSTNHWVTPHWNGCSDDDDSAWDCTALNPQGKKVSVTVCSNFWFKGSTIRH